MMIRLPPCIPAGVDGLNDFIASFVPALRQNEADY